MIIKMSEGNVFTFTIYTAKLYILHKILKLWPFLKRNGQYLNTTLILCEHNRKCVGINLS